jgi:hypothetical protein
MKKLFRHLQLGLFWTFTWELETDEDLEFIYVLTFSSLFDSWEQKFYCTVAEYTYAEEFTRMRHFEECLHDKKASERLDVDPERKGYIGNSINDNKETEFINGKGWSKIAENGSEETI